MKIFHKMLLACSLSTLIIHCLESQAMDSPYPDLNREITERNTLFNSQVREESNKQHYWESFIDSFFSSSHISIPDDLLAILIDPAQTIQSQSDNNSLPDPSSHTLDVIDLNATRKSLSINPRTYDEWATSPSRKTSLFQKSILANETMPIKPAIQKKQRLALMRKARITKDQAENITHLILNHLSSTASPTNHQAWEDMARQTKSYWDHQNTKSFAGYREFLYIQTRNLSLSLKQKTLLTNLAQGSNRLYKTQRDR